MLVEESFSGDDSFNFPFDLGDFCLQELFCSFFFFGTFVAIFVVWFFGLRFTPIFLNNSMCGNGKVARNLC